MALQHLRSSTANKRPTPGSMSDGQLAINTEATSPGVFFKNSAGNLVKVGPVHVGTSAPNVSPAGQAGNSTGEIWLDTTGGSYVIKIWDGSAWRNEAAAAVTSVGGQTGAVTFATTWAVGTGATAANNTDLDVAGTYAQTVVAIGALNIDCSTGNYFTKTINGASTFTVSNVPSSRSYSFVLELEHTSGAITWFSGVEWPSGTAPTLTTGKTHFFIFHTDNGGTRWRASSLINYTT